MVVGGTRDSRPRRDFRQDRRGRNISDTAIGAVPLCLRRDVAGRSVHLSPPGSADVSKCRFGVVSCASWGGRGSGATPPLCIRDLSAIRTGTSSTGDTVKARSVSTREFGRSATTGSGLHDQTDTDPAAASGRCRWIHLGHAGHRHKRSWWWCEDHSLGRLGRPQGSC